MSADWKRITERDEQLTVELWYPRVRKAQSVRVSLFDVRAADDIVISFDFARNGWVIRMDSTHDDDSGIIKIVEEGVEVAFVPAWNEAGVPSISDVVSKLLESEWLVEHDRQVTEKAFREGVDAGKFMAGM